MKILAIGKNYVSSADQIAAAKPTNPIIFSKPESSLVVNNSDVIFPSFTEDLRYEVELVLKIGRKGKDVDEKDAISYVSGLGIGIDFTAKDIFNASREQKGPWDLGKGFDGAAPISSFKPITNFKDLKAINFGLSINGESKQIGNTQLMITTFSEMIVYVTKYMTLEPDDLLFTGTPATGTGQIFKGDRIQASIEEEILLDFQMI